MARQTPARRPEQNQSSAQCTEALYTRECMVAHQLAVPRTVVAELSIYEEMRGCVFNSGVAALINCINSLISFFISLFLFPAAGWANLAFFFFFSSGVAEFLHCENRQLWL